MVVIQCGTASGPVIVTVEHHDRDPEPRLDDSWTAISEVSHRLVSGKLAVIEIFGPMVDGLPIFHGEPGSWCRIRVHAKGRDSASEHNLLHFPLEEHVVQIWAAPQAPPTTIRDLDRIWRSPE